MAFNNVPANGWPQLKELEKLDALAKQIENMPTFTSADRAFLEDLPEYPDTDGTKMLTATTTGGNTSLSYEDIPEELPADPESDGTRVLTATTDDGTTVKSWEAYQSMPDYSTTEQKTGQKWIDGKDIFFKTFNVGALPSSGNVNIQNDIANFGTVVNVETVGVSNDGYSFSNDGLVMNAASDNSLSFRVTFDATGYNGYVTVYYTKTT